MILKMILKSLVFQCDFDFDFQITTSRMIWILILNHLYLGDLILILKSSTYDDFAHLCLYANLAVLYANRTTNPNLVTCPIVCQSCYLVCQSHTKSNAVNAHLEKVDLYSSSASRMRVEVYRP